MSKEELLKYLIAEIDLIMHDKDYRFENANGTWYSRESCRDLTNEEVFEELRTELRQFADLEAKLVESEKSKESYRLQNEHHHLQLLQFYSRLGVEAFGADIHEKALETLMIMKEHLAEKEEQLELANKQITEAENQLEKQASIHYRHLKEVVSKQHQNKISFALEQLEKVKSAFSLINSKLDKVETIKEYIHYIDHQINELKEMK